MFEPASLATDLDPSFQNLAKISESLDAEERSVEASEKARKTFEAKTLRRSSQNP
jgi:hypothetical protein